MNEDRNKLDRLVARHHLLLQKKESLLKEIGGKRMKNDAYRLVCQEIKQVVRKINRLKEPLNDEKT